FATLVATLAGASGRPGPCKPGTYACNGSSGWKICTTEGKWVSGGTCPPDTVCKFYPPNLSPYCVPPNFQFP
ncbi:hypothetical protein BKA56DRAFT_458792, partial [Ilyonectria sp. MPI-CAGE-AT-0026]